MLIKQKGDTPCLHGPASMTSNCRSGEKVPWTGSQPRKPSKSVLRIGLQSPNFREGKSDLWNQRPRNPKSSTQPQYISFPSRAQELGERENDLGPTNIMEPKVLSEEIQSQGKRATGKPSLKSLKPEAKDIVGPVQSGLCWKKFGMP